MIATSFFLCLIQDMKVKKERNKITKLTLQMAVILRKIAIRKKNYFIAKQKHKRKEIQNGKQNHRI